MNGDHLRLGQGSDEGVAGPSRECLRIRVLLHPSSAPSGEHPDSSTPTDDGRGSQLGVSFGAGSPGTVALMLDPL